MHYIFVILMFLMFGISDILLGFIFKNHIYCIIGVGTIAIAMFLKFMPGIVCFFLNIKNNKLEDNEKNLML